MRALQYRMAIIPDSSPWAIAQVVLFNKPTYGKSLPMPPLTANALQMLLSRLDSDLEAAAEKYEVLRLKLTRWAVWKGCPESEADALADEACDRIAVKIEGGEVIENINAYAGTVMRFVWLEWLRKNPIFVPIDDDGGEADDRHGTSTEDPDDEEDDVYIICLRVCMNEVVTDDGDKQIIIDYYDPDPGQKNKEHRKDMAERFGLTMTTLKVRASRIRARLETCINECIARRR